MTTTVYDTLGDPTTVSRAGREIHVHMCVDDAPPLFMYYTPNQCRQLRKALKKAEKAVRANAA